MTVPTLAQGGAQALEDAVVLADYLDERGIGTAALAAYERERKDRLELSTHATVPRRPVDRGDVRPGRVRSDETDGIGVHR